VHIANFVEDADSPDWSLPVVFTSSSKKMPVRYLQVAHDHFFLYPSYPAIHWLPLQVKFALNPIGSCQAYFRYRELPVYFILPHIIISFEACTLLLLYITRPHFDASLCDIRWLVHLHVLHRVFSEMQTVPKSRGTQIVQKSGSHLKIWGARMVRWNRFHTEDPEIFGAMVKNLIALVT
jgi:hypothetical protein